MSTPLSSDPAAGEFELVERKGVGHPDTICDAISERVSRRYTEYCRSTFGAVAHHWFDKVMLYGGEADIGYGVGELTAPYTVLVAGKCAFKVGDAEIPVEDIAREAVHEVLSSTLTGFDPGRHVRVQVVAVDHTGAGRTSDRYRPASIEDLVTLDDVHAVSNDSNLLVGYSPLTQLEQLVLDTERFLNGAELKAANPDTGSDIKVFGTRMGSDVGLLVTVPFLGQAIRSWDAYVERRRAVAAVLADRLAERFDATVRLTLNPADGTSHPYLVALGSVADTGDVGATGRGNRINGLITPMRPMSIEAPAGKNPVDHTGKLYGVAAQEIAETLASELSAGVEVFVQTAKGSPTSAPDRVMVNVARSVGDGEQRAIQETVADAFGGIRELTTRFVEREVVMW